MERTARVRRAAGGPRPTTPPVHFRRWLGGGASGPAAATGVAPPRGPRAPRRRAPGAAAGRARPRHRGLRHRLRAPGGPLRHERFGTFDFDLGIYDQAVWLLAHGHGFDTVRGLGVFGNHVSLAFYLLVPFYWLGAGPNFLNLVMVARSVPPPSPVFRLGRIWLRDDWHALVPALAFLLHFTSQWMVRETFHRRVVALFPVLHGVPAATESRMAPALWMVFAVAWKDIALAPRRCGGPAPRGAGPPLGTTAPAGPASGRWWRRSAGSCSAPPDHPGLQPRRRVLRGTSSAPRRLPRGAGRHRVHQPDRRHPASSTTPAPSATSRPAHALRLHPCWPRRCC